MKQKKRSFVSSQPKFLLSAILLLSLAVSIFGGGDKKITPPSGPVKISEWDVVGPNGGDVRVVTIDPKNKDSLFVSTLDGSIHHSTDGGKTWNLLVNLNMPQLVLDQLLVDSRDSKVIYTSGHRHKDPGGFFMTRDGGVTWKEAKELRNTSIHAMRQSVKNPSFILVGTTDGMWKTENSGDSWTKIQSATMPDTAIDSIAIDPRDDDTIYAGTWWRAYKTTDGGKNWRLIKNGMIDDSDVFAIEIDLKNPDHVIASACSGIYESYNRGEKWAKVQGIPSQSRRTRDIKLNPVNAGTVYAATTEGFWMTTGKGWIITTQKDLEINSIAVHPDEPNRVFIGTNNYGVMVSNDGGRNFTQTNDNFTSRFAYTITADIEQPNRLYATTHNTATGGGFVFISNDGGNNWIRPKNYDVIRVSPFGMLQDRQNPNTIYMATNVGMYKSLDRGNAWEQITPPKPKPVPTPKRKATKKAPAKPAKPVNPEPEPVYDPTAPVFLPALTEKVKVLAYTEDGRNGYYAGTDKGLYRSYDISKGWEKVPFSAGMSENVFVIYSSPLMPGTIWIGTDQSGVLLSRDDGKTWQKVEGVPDEFPISSIAVDPKRPEIVYVGTTKTLYMSRDGGRSWVRRGGNLPLGNFTSILINPKNTDEVFLSSALETDGGIYYSKDAGQSWKRVDSKDMKLPSRRVWSMIFDPSNPSRIFAATHSSGIYRIERDPVTASTESGTRPRVSTTGN